MNAITSASYYPPPSWLVRNLDGRPPSGQQLGEMWDSAASKLPSALRLKGMSVGRAKLTYLNDLMRIATMNAERPHITGGLDCALLAELMQNPSAVWLVEFEIDDDELERESPPRPDPEPIQ